MTKRMLIDGAHPEETRVVIVDGNQLEDFDYESTNRQTLKGNIYLGKITRVEPSLQACFVEYGGNRHGFLPFGEIHPDYYRIPVADREALKAAEAAALEAAEAREDRRAAEAAAAEAAATEGNGEADGDEPEGASGESDSAEADNGENEAPEAPEPVGGEDEDDHRRRVARLRRAYTIQEVIKRRQIVLVQVVKEERGTKGAALTTYISLAGRYCVLMPNTTSGGGISRKITNAADRKRLKEIVDDLEVPTGMAVILRTAGLERTKTEIKRDYEFLMKVWDDIASRTLESRAPTLIHEEANLIKRAIRDNYGRDVEEVLVDGEDAYRTAKGFMRALMPSHAKKVQLYKEGPVPLFTRYGVESQLDALHATTVRLPSGGYIVINTTEALVAIDVNSGRSTRERGIEETAYKTNLEAATAVARQLRLRDLAGLIVIDFIDMEDRRNNAAVERRLKEAMKADRARLQIGRISSFGLLELSRQRLRPSLFESSTHICPTCGGTGHVRSVESSGLHVLRAIEEEAVTGRHAEISVHVATPVALYLLNQKRDALNRIARDHGMDVWVEADDSLLAPAYRLTGLRAKLRDMDDEEEGNRGVRSLPPPPAPRPAEIVEAEEEAEDEAVAAREERRDDEQARDESDEDSRNRRRRGRRGGRRRGRGPNDDPAERTAEGGDTEAAEDAEQSVGETEEAQAPTAEDEGGSQDRPRRRRRRGGRNRRNGEAPSDIAAMPEGAPPADEAAPGGVTADTDLPAEAADLAPIEAARFGASQVEAAPVDAVPAEAAFETAPVEQPQAAFEAPAAAEGTEPAPAESDVTAAAVFGAAAAISPVADADAEPAPEATAPAEPSPAEAPAAEAAPAEPVAEAAPAKRKRAPAKPRDPAKSRELAKPRDPAKPARKPRMTKAALAAAAAAAESAAAEAGTAPEPVAETPVAAAVAEPTPAAAETMTEAPVSGAVAVEASAPEAPAAESIAPDAPAVAEPPTPAEPEAPAAAAEPPAPEPQPAPEPEPDPDLPKRRGWWNRAAS